MTDYYVAPGGDDCADGAASRPFATLTRARDAARAAGVGSERRIILRDGRYYDAELVLGAEDNGLVMEAADGETPILYGGRPISGWHEIGDDLWAADLRGVKEGAWDFRMLCVDDGWRPRARLPKEGFLEHEDSFDVRWMSTTGGGWERKPTPEELTTMHYRAGDLGEWVENANAEITVYHMWDDTIVGVRSIDHCARAINFSIPLGHPPGAFGIKRYVLWNVREGMHEPGQWFLDRAHGRVVYWPMPGEDMGRVRVVAPTTECIIRLGGAEDAPVKDVAMDGLTLSTTTTPMVASGFGAGAFAGAVTADYASGCRLVDLRVQNVGGQGIYCRRCGEMTIDNCETQDTGACGIRITGCHGCSVTECAVHGVGRTYPAALAVQLSGRDNVFAHNEVWDATYSGLGGSGDGHRIEGNLFHNVMTALADGAAIYVTFCKNVIVRGNFVYDIEREKAAHAYYLDEQAQGCVVENNVALNTGWPSHNHMAWDNVIRNNVFVDDGDCKLTFPKSERFTFERNVIAAGGNVAFHWVDAIESMPANVLFSAGGDITTRGVVEGYELAEPKEFTPRDGTVVADPLLADPAGHDFRFEDGSPAIELGIAPLDVGRAGRTRR